MQRVNSVIDEIKQRNERRPKNYRVVVTEGRSYRKVSFGMTANSDEEIKRLASRFASNMAGSWSVLEIVEK